MTDHSPDPERLPAELANANPTASDAWALFGATGVTGRMVLARALEQGLRPRLIGRDSPALRALAAEHGLACRIATLDRTDSLADAFAGLRLVLNAAGPYAQTAQPLIDATMAAGADYLDLDGELEPLARLLDQDAAARARGIALVGGGGFGVAAGEGLAQLLAERLGGADRLRISVAAESAHASPAVAQSTLAVLAGGGFAVDAGALVPARLAARRWRSGATAFAAAPLAELVAARHTTGAARIDAGVPMPRTQALVLALIAPLLPDLLRFAPVRRALANTGGHGGAAGSAPRRSWVRVEAWHGERHAAATLHAGEGFAVAADIAVAALTRMLTDRPAPGAHAPAGAFGSGFVGSVPGIAIQFD